MATKKTGSGKAKAAPLDPKVADKLLDLLSTDNAFRRLFKKDAGAALAKVGHRPAEPGAARLGCMQVVHIAPKEEIAAARNAIFAHLTSTASQTVVFCFEADKVTSSLRRK